MYQRHTCAESEGACQLEAGILRTLHKGITKFSTRACTFTSVVTKKDSKKEEHQRGGNNRQTTKIPQRLAPHELLVDLFFQRQNLFHLLGKFLRNNENDPSVYFFLLSARRHCMLSFTAINVV